MKNIRIFYLKIFLFLVVKFSIYLNRHVFVMYLNNMIRAVLNFAISLSTCEKKLANLFYFQKTFLKVYLQKCF